MALVQDTLDIIKTALVFMVKMPCMLVRKERAPDWLSTQQGPPTPRLCSDTLLMTELGVFVIFGMEKEPQPDCDIADLLYAKMFWPHHM